MRRLKNTVGPLVKPTGSNQDLEYISLKDLYNKYINTSTKVSNGVYEIMYNLDASRDPDRSPRTTGNAMFTDQADYHFTRHIFSTSNFRDSNIGNQEALLMYESTTFNRVRGSEVEDVIIYSKSNPNDGEIYTMLKNEGSYIKPYYDSKKNRNLNNLFPLIYVSTDENPILEGDRLSNFRESDILLTKDLIRRLWAKTSLENIPEEKYLLSIESRNIFKKDMVRRHVEAIIYMGYNYIGSTEISPMIYKFFSHPSENRTDKSNDRRFEDMIELFTLNENNRFKVFEDRYNSGETRKKIFYLAANNKDIKYVEYYDGKVYSQHMTEKLFYNENSLTGVTTNEQIVREIVNRFDNQIPKLHFSVDKNNLNIDDTSTFDKNTLTANNKINRYVTYYFRLVVNPVDFYDSNSRTKRYVYEKYNITNRSLHIYLYIKKGEAYIPIDLRLNSESDSEFRKMDKTEIINNMNNNLSYIYNFGRTKENANKELRLVKKQGSNEGGLKFIYHDGNSSTDFDKE